MPAWFMRAARPDDAGAVAALVERAYHPYLALLSRRPAPMDDDYPGRIASGQAFVATTAGSLAGVLVLVNEPGTLLVDNVAVDPACQSTGLGRWMLQWAEAEAARRRLPALRLYTNERMERNVALYRRLGFTETHRAEQDGHRRVFMVKRLDSAAGR